MAILVNKAGKLDLVVAKGELFTATFSSANNYSTYTIEMDVRDKAGSDTTLYTASTTGGQITFDGSGNPILSIPASITQAFSFSSGVYDMKFTNAGATAVSFFFEGQFFVKQTVTR